MVGVRSNSDISGNPICYNNFWDTDGKVELELNTIDGQKSLADWHSLGGQITGNISMSVPVDTTYSYAAEDLDVGRLTGARPDDVVYGGEYLSWLPFDRDGESRSESSMVETMGPYELGNSSYLPAYIHVSPNGDDGNPLGTEKRPFATLARAYNIARTDTDVSRRRYDALAIRMAEGSYNMNDGGSVLDIKHRTLSPSKVGGTPHSPVIMRVCMKQFSPGILLLLYLQSIPIMFKVILF